MSKRYFLTTADGPKTFKELFPEVAKCTVYIKLDGKPLTSRSEQEISGQYPCPCGAEFDFADALREAINARDPEFEYSGCCNKLGGQLGCPEYCSVTAKFEYSEPGEPESTAP